MNLGSFRGSILRSVVRIKRGIFALFDSTLLFVTFINKFTVSIDIFPEFLLFFVQ